MYDDEYLICPYCESEQESYCHGMESESYKSSLICEYCNEKFNYFADVCVTYKSEPIEEVLKEYKDVYWRRVRGNKRNKEVIKNPDLAKKQKAFGKRVEKDGFVFFKSQRGGITESITGVYLCEFSRLKSYLAMNHQQVTDFIEKYKPVEELEELIED